VKDITHSSEYLISAFETTNSFSVSSLRKYKFCVIELFVYKNAATYTASRNAINTLIQDF